MTCSNCEFSEKGHTGPDCPMRRIGVKASFSAGCNLFRNANCIPGDVLRRHNPGPTPTPAQGGDRGKAVKRAKEKGPNKTESEYYRNHIKPMLDDGKIEKATYEGVTFRLANSHRYTPDWACVYSGNHRLMLVEVKGSYKFGSHGRARLAFDQARTEYPMFDWIWATKTKEGWVCE